MGLRTLPCGTLKVRVTGSDVAPSRYRFPIATHCILFDRYEPIHDRTVPWMLKHLCRWSSKMVWSTVWKVADRSNRSRQTMPLSSMMFRISDFTLRSVVSVLISSIYRLIWSHEIIAVNILHQLQGYCMLSCLREKAQIWDWKIVFVQKIEIDLHKELTNKSFFEWIIEGSCVERFVNYGCHEWYHFW